jgi:hypothetical protein
VAVGEAFPTGPAFLLAKSSFPTLKTPTILSQQELGNPVGKAFANRIGVFANNVFCSEGKEIKSLLINFPKNVCEVFIPRTDAEAMI